MAVRAVWSELVSGVTSLMCWESTGNHEAEDRREMERATAGHEAVPDRMVVRDSGRGVESDARRMDETTDDQEDDARLLN